MMAKRSVKLDSAEKVITGTLNTTTRKLSGFSDDFSSQVSSIQSNPVDYLNAKLLKGTALSDVVSPISDLASSEPQLNINFKGGDLSLPEGWISEISDVLSTTRSVLSSVRTLLGVVKQILTALRLLNQNIDDALYLLIRKSIEMLVTFVDLLTPQVGVHLLTIPPNIPSTTVLNTSLDDAFNAAYDSFLQESSDEIFRPLVGTFEEYIVEDLAYSPKGYPTASSAESLRSLIKSTLDDKYDYMRPFHSPGLELASNSGHSAGLILTAGGPLSTVLDAMRTWDKIFNGIESTLRLADGTYSPVIEYSKYLGKDSSGDHKISIKYNMSGYSYNPSVSYTYRPTHICIITYSAREGKIPNPLDIYKLEYGNISEDTSESKSYEVTGYSGAYTISRKALNFPDLDSLSNRLVHEYLTNTSTTHIATLSSTSNPEGSTLNVFVIATYYDKYFDDTVEVYSTSNILLSTPSAAEVSSSKAVLPNWQGASLGLKPLVDISEYLTSLTSDFTSIFERGIVNPLDGSLELIEDYLDQLDNVIRTIDIIVFYAQQLLSLNLGGYASVYTADTGSLGVKAAVDNHFDELKKEGVTWSGQSTAALVMLAQSDSMQDLEVFIAILDMLFGSSKKRASIGSTIDSIVIPESSIVSQEFIVSPMGQEFKTFDISMQPAECGHSPEDI